jgi:hypothetical protein
MENYICETCGTQQAASAQPPAHCAICEDARQYIGWQGQRWTTLAALGRDHHNRMQLEEPDLTGIGAEPAFAIGQRALLVQTPAGNVLWDCIPLLDAATIAAVRALGGIRAIAISHPHFYASMVEWARAFDAPVYLHADDRAWVLRPDPAIRFWEGEEQRLWDGLTLIRCGGHFPGSTALHWPAGAAGRGALLTGDTLMVASDRRYVSFMYSFPNYVPLSAPAVQRVVAAVEPWPFDRIYAAWWDRVVADDAKAAVARSAARYLAAIQAP